MKNTKLPIPAILTRTITDRVVFRYDGDGLLSLQDANRNNEIANLQINAGDAALEVVYTTNSTDHCGAVSIQPDDWEVVCRAEASLSLGCVNFPFLRGARYTDHYPQSERVRVIAVRFTKEADRARIVAEIMENIRGVDYRSQQVCEIAPGTAFTAVFAGFTENRAQPVKDVNGDQIAEIVQMPAGGVLSLTRPMSGGYQGPILLG